MTVAGVKGRGGKKGLTEIYQGREYHIDIPLTPESTIVVRCGVGQVVDTVAKAARTGKIWDGKIFTLPAE